MKISVTQEHIDKGCRRCAFKCALVLALNDLGFDVMVEPASVSFYSEVGDFLGELPLPLEAQYFQIAFDKKDELVQPFEYEMPELTFPVSEIRFPQSPSVSVT